MPLLDRKDNLSLAVNSNKVATVRPMPIIHRDCCEIDLSRFLILNLDRLTGKIRDFGTENHQKLEIFRICDSVCVFRNSLVSIGGIAA